MAVGQRCAATHPGGAHYLPLNGKPYKRAGLDGLNLYAGYRCPGWPLMAPGNELVELTGRPGSLYEYAAIGLVFNDAGKAQLQCFFFGALAVKYTLHLAGDGDRYCLNHAGKVRIEKNN